MKTLDNVRKDTHGSRVLANPRLLPEPVPSPVLCPVISVDDHLLETANLFSRVPSRFADAAPRMLEDERGLPFWEFDGDRYPIFGSNASMGRPMDEWLIDSIRFDQMRAGVWDPKARLHDMDIAGVWASINFCSSTWGFAGTRFSRMKDPEVGFASMRSYNDWVLEEWCGTDRERFIPCQIAWLADAELAASEIRRNAALGFPCVSFSENPESLGFPSIYTEEWDPFFAACVETDTILNLHVGSSGSVSQPSSDSPGLAIAALFPINGITTFIDWVHAKIPLRFPGIKIVLSEGGASWVPMALERLRRVNDRRTSSDWWGPNDPSPLDLVENFYFASVEDPSAFHQLDLIGEDKVMVEVDYPHGDSSWPTTQDVFRAELAGLPDETIRKVCYKNAASLFRHPEPPASWFEGATVGAG